MPTREEQIEAATRVYRDMFNAEMGADKFGPSSPFVDEADKHAARFAAFPKDVQDEARRRYEARMSGRSRAREQKAKQKRSDKPSGILGFLARLFRDR